MSQNATANNNTTLQNQKSIKTEYKPLLAEYENKLTRLSSFGIELYAKVMSAIAIQRECEKLFYTNNNPDEYLESFLQKHINYLDVTLNSVAHLEADGFRTQFKDDDEFVSQDDLHKYLFNKTWKTLKIADDQANDYVPWIELIEDRLKINGLDEAYFSGKKTLDVGCGTGRFSFSMARLGAESYGIDVGEASLNYAQEIAKVFELDNVFFKKSSAYDLVFEDNTFDFVVCNGVLHHLDKPLDSLKEIYRVLKPGGEFWLYIEGSGGIYHELWDVLQKAFMNVPLNKTFDVLEAMKIPKVHFWMDKFYAKYHFISWKDNEKRLTDLGFTSIKRLKGTTITDLDVAMFNDDPYAETKFGDGNMRMLITK